VTDGSHTATLTLLGQYSAANFSLSSDGVGGTLIKDPAVTASASIAAPQQQPAAALRNKHVPVSPIRHGTVTMIRNGVWPEPAVRNRSRAAYLS
jgi:hypothetical protein